MTRLAELALFTDEVEASVSFYRHLLGGEPVAAWPGGAVFTLGDVKMLVHERSAVTDEGPLNEDHFALAVPDVDAAYHDLRERGIAFLVEPRDYPWGRSAYLRDPDGRFVELAGPQG